ncbi:MAG: hypothetical protein N4A43_01865 [Alphaproteobacteria bacterium]|jgi:hypothetical protein|nr:hypothetical protein [Alphaproteobacteria bacterium]
MFLKKFILSTSTLGLLAFGVNKLPELVETNKITEINGIKKQTKAEQTPFSEYEHDSYAKNSNKVFSKASLLLDKKEKTKKLTELEKEKLIKKRLARLQKQYDSTTSRVVTPETAPNIADEAKQFGEDTKNIAVEIVNEAYKNSKGKTEGEKSIDILKSILNNYGGNSYRNKDNKPQNPTP